MKEACQSVYFTQEHQKLMKIRVLDNNRAAHPHHEKLFTANNYIDYIDITVGSAKLYNIACCLVVKSLATNLSLNSPINNK